MNHGLRGRWRPAALALGAAVAATPAPGAALQVVPERAVYGHLFEGPFQQPRGVYFDSNAGELFICDSGGHRIAIATDSGVPKFSFGSPESLISPNDVAVDAEGRILVADSGHLAIRVFDYDGEPLPDLELTGLSDTERPFRPDALVLADGVLYTLDRANRRVVMADGQGRVTREMRTPPGRTDLLVSPVDLAVTRAGELVVLDSRGLAVQVYDSSGQFLRGWGEHDTGPAAFSLPSAVAVGRHDRIFVTDELRHDIKVFSAEGAFLMNFGGFGSAPGAVRHPVGVASDGRGRIFVAERTGGRVQVFRVEEGE